MEPDGMLYFIPAWYAESSWREDEQFWYRRRMRAQTDDTVKQLQLFQRNRICEYQILLLSHAPNFRHFLHRQGIFRVPYWSVFDAIQEVRRKRQALFSFRDLSWPEDVDFFYAPFSVFARRNRERYANIEFGEYGNPIEIDLYENGKICRKNIYDDRGFLSCTSVYKNGERSYDQYLTEKGIWKLCHFADGHVAVNPKDNRYLISAAEGEERFSFLKSSYASMEEVIGEVFAAFLRTTRRWDVFCVAAHGQHLALLDKLLADRKTIFSVFENRLGEDRGALEALSHGDYIVTDTEENLETLSGEKSLENVVKVNIPPYVTRIEPGISQQLPVQKILFPVDHLSAETLAEAVTAMAAYLKRNPRARVHLFTRNMSFGWDEELLAQVGEILERHGYPPEWARKGGQNESEAMLDREDRIPVLFVVEQRVDELETSKCVREQRVLVDLADRPDLFLQILCVSIGVPQILRTATGYMQPGKNGRVNRDLSELGEDLAYYLESLSNWNQALIRSYELGRSHMTQNLIELWKEVIVHIEGGTGIAAGEDRF